MWQPAWWTIFAVFAAGCIRGVALFSTPTFTVTQLPDAPSGEWKKPVKDVTADVSWVRPLFTRPPSDNGQKLVGQVTGSIGGRDSSKPRLVGIIWNGDGRTAILVIGNSAVRGSVGSVIGQWTVVGIERRSVTLRSSAGDETFQLAARQEK